VNCGFFPNTLGLTWIGLKGANEKRLVMVVPRRRTMRIPVMYRAREEVEKTFLRKRFAA